LIGTISKIHLKSQYLFPFALEREIKPQFRVHDDIILTNKMREWIAFVIMYTMKLFLGMKALIQRKDGKVLLLREAAYDEGTNAGKWDVPGGRINPEESIYEALRREVMEESGLEIEVIETLGSGETFPTIKGEACHIVRLYTLCAPKSEEVVLSGDHDSYEWVDPKNLDDRECVSDIRIMMAKVTR
jgi:8-oxo-dGTP diphosphatase